MVVIFILSVRVEGSGHIHCWGLRLGSYLFCLCLGLMVGYIAFNARKNKQINCLSYSQPQHGRFIISTMQKTNQPSISNATITTPIIQLARKSVIIDPHQHKNTTQASQQHKNTTQAPHQHKNTTQVQQLFSRIDRLVARTEAIMSKMDEIEKKRSTAAAKTITIKV